MCIAGYCVNCSFKVINVVRQGGILSPKLFIVYMDGLSDQLNNWRGPFKCYVTQMGVGGGGGV